MPFRAVAAVRWELPFPVRVDPVGILAWEPLHGVGTIVFVPQVGALIWRRRCTFLSPDKIYPGPPPEVSPDEIPVHDYLLVSVTQGGGRVPTLKLDGGPAGGFEEARPYSVANTFVCVADGDSEAADAILPRAEHVLNNFLALYGFFTQSTVVRPLSIESDSYYTVVSLANVPAELREVTAEQLLLSVDKLRFSSTLGRGRTHNVGTNSFEDLLPGAPLQGESFDQLCRLLRSEQQLELWIKLFQSALRRLKRREHVLAILDAQSGFEVGVTAIVRDALSQRCSDTSEVDAEVIRLHDLQAKLVWLDRVGKANGSTTPFLGGERERAWRRGLYDLRHSIVHRGVRHLDFDTAKAGIVAGLQAMDQIQSMSLSFQRPFMWTGAATNLAHIRNTAGRMARLFEL